MGKYRMYEKPLRLVIFDVDGTLVDSQAAILAAIDEAFLRAGRPVPGCAEALGVVGLSLVEAMAVLVPEADAASMPGWRSTTARPSPRSGSGRAARRRRRSIPALFRLYSGARETVMRLDAAGWLLSIATERRGAGWSTSWWRMGSIGTSSARRRLMTRHPSRTPEWC